MTAFPVTETVALVIGVIVTWLMGWARTFLARRVAVSTPTDRKVKRLTGTVRRLSQHTEAMSDRMSMQSQSIIVLANAVKTGDQAQVARSLDLMAAGENQYLASLTAHFKSDGEDEA